MNTNHLQPAIAKLAVALATCALLLTGCSGGSSSSSSSGSGTVTGVTTPSKVSVVNTN